MGLASRTDRMNPFSANPGPLQGMQNAKIFDKMNTLARAQAPPPVKFKDLEEVVNHKITMNLMPFEARADFVKVTGDTVLVPVTVGAAKQRHYLCGEGRNSAGSGQHLRPRDESDRQGCADIRGHRSGGRAEGSVGTDDQPSVALLEGCSTCAQAAIASISW